MISIILQFFFLGRERGRDKAKKKKNSEDKEIKTPTDIYAPLVLYPVKLTREKTGSGFNYFLESEENEIVVNESLKSKLQKEEGVNLPDLKFNEDKPLIEDYFKQIYLHFPIGANVFLEEMYMNNRLHFAYSLYKKDLKLF